MKVPRSFRLLIKKLLAPSRGTISIKGCSLISIEMSGGVKQGCPAAMVLFTLAFDPIIRWICSVLSPFDCFVGAYCDDIGIVTNNLISTWTLLSKLFKLVTLRRCYRYSWMFSIVIQARTRQRSCSKRFQCCHNNDLYTVLAEPV